MDILVVSNSCSETKYREVCRLRTKQIVDPQQKFFRLMTEGLAAGNNVRVTALSALPVSASTVRKYIFSEEEEKVDNIDYHYLRFFNGKMSRYLSLFVGTVFFFIKWCNRHQKENTWVIVDSLIPILSIPIRVIAQLKGFKVAAVVTDIPSLSTNMKERKENKLKTFLLSAYQRISDRDLHRYDAYIPLTESINEVVNVFHKPYIVVEGFADSKDLEINNRHEPFIMYAGGIYEKYGVKLLVEAFLKLKNKEYDLYLFGEGTYVDEILEIQKTHPNVKYMGCISAEKVVQYEKKAAILVNPRPSSEMFSKYSFPSKTMEYLLSGTPVVSTRLSGIPEDYFQYIYSIDEETSDGICKTLESVLSKSKEELFSQGKRGHIYVIENKNNIKMSGNILRFLQEIDL